MAQKTDVQLQTDRATIENETVAGANTVVRVGNMFEDIIDSKVNNTRTVNGHALSGDVTVTASNVGLGNVDNTSDVNKPVSTAQQSALDLKLTIPGAWTTWVPTLVGWSSYTLDYAKYSQIGKTVNIKIYVSIGVSNSTTKTFTLPVTAGGNQYAQLSFAYNGGGITNESLVSLTSGSAVASLFTDANGVGWLNGSMIFALTLTYEAQ